MRTTEGETSIIKQLQLPEKAEFDETVKVRLVRRRSQLQDTVPGYVNVFVASQSEFDYIPRRTGGEYQTELRVIRFRADDRKTTVTVITNRPETEFPTRKIKQLYRERWMIETAFAGLKGALAMESFHTNRPELLEQEVWGKMTAFNYVSAIRRAANNEARKRDRKRDKKLKHKYDVDFTFACTASLAFLNPASLRYHEKDLIYEVSRKRHPIRKNRDNPPRGQSKRNTPISNTHRCAVC